MCVPLARLAPCFAHGGRAARGACARPAPRIYIYTHTHTYIYIYIRICIYIYIYIYREREGEIYTLSQMRSLLLSR